jgi:hypothetical protein
MRKFTITFEQYEEIDRTTIEIHQAVFDAVDDDWRASFYDLHTDEEIAAHIGYNMVINRASLNQLDGWANLPADYARVGRWPTLDDWEVNAIEVLS